jgi:hypothetical protein
MVLTISEIASRLHQIGEELNTKDTLIVMMNDVINTVNKLIYDPSFVCSSIYAELKVKYISQLEPKIIKIKSVTNKSDIAPIYIPRSPRSQNNIDIEQSKEKDTNENVNSTKVTKTKKKKPQIITSEVNAPIEVDIYRNPKYKPKIIKSSKSVDKKININEKLPEHFFKYKDNTYYIDFNTNKIYNKDYNKIGYLSTDNLYINDDIIKLNCVSNFNGTNINENYGIN